MAARAKLDAAVKGASAASASELSSELFFAAEVFAKNTSLRRAFADPSRDASAKGALVSGDSVSYGGVKITVVEAGDFGDVVRVEPGA